MAGDVGHHLRLVVDLVPNDGVRLPCGAGSAHGEDEAPCPRHLQQLQHLETVTMEIIKTLRFKVNTLCGLLTERNANQSIAQRST